MVHNKKTVVAAMGLFAALAGGNVSAVTMVTLTGMSVDYTFDQEDLGLFGTASLSGDELVFTPLPSGFAASSDGSPAANHLINVTVSAHTGYLLTAFNLNEEGRYSLTGEDASVYASGYLGALDIEGNTSNNLNSSLQSSLLTNGTWTASAGVTLPAMGWGGTDGIVSSVSLAISNDLFADGGSGSASIYKDFVGLTAVTAPIPEAQTYAMMLAGLGLIGFMVRRKSGSAT